MNSPKINDNNNNIIITESKIKISKKKKKDTSIKKSIKNEKEEDTLSLTKNNEDIIEVDPIIDYYQNDLNFKNKSIKLCRLCFYQDKYYFIDNNNLVYTIPFIYYNRYQDLDKSYLSKYLKDQEPFLTENDPDISYLVGVRNKDKIDFDPKFLILEEKIEERKKKNDRSNDFNIDDKVINLQDNNIYKIIEKLNKNNFKIESKTSESKIVNINFLKKIN